MPLVYPETPACAQVDDYHGEAVADPYRWLEDADSPDTVRWIEAQNELTRSWLDTVPGRDEISARVAELWDHPRFGAPFERGGRWFQYRNSGLQAQPVLYLMDAPAEEGVVLLDPNTRSGDGTVAVTDAVPSHDGRLLAFATSGAGSDWLTWHVLDVETRQELPDVVEWSKFSTAAWLADGSGFFYGAPEVPEAGTEYEGETRHQRVLLHRLGTSTTDDEIVFSRPAEPDWLPHATTTDDGRYLVISISRGTAPEARLEIVDLEDLGSTTVLDPDFAVEAQVAGNVGQRFFVVTTHGAERRRVVAVDLVSPEVDHWQEIVGERDDTLLGARQCGSALVCWYLRDASCVVRVHELDGRFVRELEIPPFSSLQEDKSTPISGRAGLDLVHLGLTSFTDSGSVWRHDLATGETRVLHPSTADFDGGSYVTERTYARSADGTVVPVFCTRRRDLAPNGDVPVLLYGYGGFDIPLGPSFSVQAAVFMERGGIYALANLRGGGEFGRSWHEDGRLANKQHVFDDFVGAARHLVASGWTRPGRIAINGGSNGGLLVGACLTQDPEAFGAAVPEVGVLDMLRFHKFTIGWAWRSDFGDPDDPVQYRWLRAYSPLHNVREGVAYPPTMVLTGDHDDRVVPGHSLKFAAALQHAQAGEPPVLLRVETSAGHGGGKPTAKQIEERSDVLTFLEGVLGRYERNADLGP